jgi:predicted nuclease of predicted toxin-antitoxin system
MRLLFDQNLAASLVQRLADVYPGSQHVRHVGLGSADDAAVWAYAAEHGLTIVQRTPIFISSAF